MFRSCSGLALVALFVITKVGENDLVPQGCRL